MPNQKPSIKPDLQPDLRPDLRPGPQPAPRPDLQPDPQQDTHTEGDTPLSLALENYLVIIFRMEFATGACRASDIAAAAGVARPSVTNALRTLSRLGYIRYAPYKQINLTEKGVLAGQKLAHRNMVLRDFFQSILQLPQDMAEETACALEHVMADEVLLRLRQFVLYMHQHKESWNGWRDEYANMREDLLHEHTSLSPDATTPAMRWRQALLQQEGQHKKSTYGSTD